MEVDYKA